MNTKTTLSLPLLLITFSFLAIEFTNGWVIGMYKRYYEYFLKMIFYRISIKQQKSKLFSKLLIEWTIVKLIKVLQYTLLCAISPIFLAKDSCR